jgi:hypothetical protein
VEKIHLLELIYTNIFMARKRGKLKEKVGFSIDKETNELLDQYCQDNMINKSKLINHLIKSFLIVREESINGY